MYYRGALLACVQLFKGSSPTQSLSELCALMFEDSSHQNIQVIFEPQETCTLLIYARQELSRTTGPLQRDGGGVLTASYWLRFGTEMP